MSERKRILGRDPDTVTFNCCACGSENYREDIWHLSDCPEGGRKLDVCQNCMEEFTQDTDTDIDCDVIPTAQFDALKLWAAEALVFSFLPAVEQINSLEDVQEFFDAMTGFLNWHPDTKFAEYVDKHGIPIYTPSDAAKLDLCMERCHKVCDSVTKAKADVYELSIASLRRVQPDFAKAVMGEAEPKIPTGRRELQHGEIVAAGDSFYNHFAKPASQWEACAATIGRKYQIETGEDVIIRKEKKPDGWTFEQTKSNPYWYAGVISLGELTIAQVSCPNGPSGNAGRGRAILLSEADNLLTSVRGLLAQLEGPVMVHGDGRGRDGKKTGLSGDEFNALRDNRIQQAHDIIFRIEREL